MRKIIISIAVAAVVIFTLVLIVKDTTTKDAQETVRETTVSDQDVTDTVETGTKVGNIAPNFELVDYNGKAASLADFEGTPVFVNFWASWCPFCVDELPLMAKIQNEFAGRYATIAINRGEDLETAKEFSDKLNITDSMTFLLDKKDGVYGRYAGFAMPYSIFIDGDGIIKDIKFGPLTEDELRQKLSTIL